MDCKVISIFQRPPNLNEWNQSVEKYDLMALLRRFVAVTKELHENFDVIITTPSSNKLNNEIFSRIVRIIPHESAFEEFFTKYEANQVYEQFIDTNWLEEHYKDEATRGKINRMIYRAILDMNRTNDGIFSYKYIKPKELRNAIIQSMYVSGQLPTS